MTSKLANYVNLFGVINDKDARLDFIMPVDSTSEWPVSEAIQLDPAVSVEFHDKGGNILLRYPIGVQTLCPHPLPGKNWSDDSRILGGVVPIPPDASSLKIVNSTSILLERIIPGNGPVVDFDWDPVKRGTDGVQKIDWKAVHPDGEPITHILSVVQEDGTWQPLTFPSTATETTVDFDELPGGKVQLGVICTDGFHVTRAASAVFELPLRPCMPNIISPIEGQRFNSNERIHLSGMGYYREKMEPEYRWLFWFDDMEGPLGPGREFDVALKPGKHQITLQAGSPGREGKATVSLFVE